MVRVIISYYRENNKKSYRGNQSKTTDNLLENKLESIMVEKNFML